MDIILDLDRRMIRDAIGVPIAQLPLKRGDSVTWRVRIATTEDVTLAGGEVVFAAAYLANGKTNLIHKTATIASDGSADIVPQSKTDGLDAVMGAGTDSPKTSLTLDGEFKVTAESGMTIATYNLPVLYMWGIAADISDPENLESTTLQIGTVETLPAGSSATASITYAAGVYSLNLGIPQGAKGDPGEADLPDNVLTAANVGNYAVTSLGGATGAVTLGSNLSVSNNVLSAAGSSGSGSSGGVTSVNGLTGDVFIGLETDIGGDGFAGVKTSAKSLYGTESSLIAFEGASLSSSYTQTLRIEASGGGSTGTASIDWSNVQLGSGGLSIKGPSGEPVIKYSPGGSGLTLGGDPSSTTAPFTEAITIWGHVVRLDAGNPDSLVSIIVNPTMVNSEETIVIETPSGSAGRTGIVIGDAATKVTMIGGIAVDGSFYYP